MAIPKHIIDQILDRIDLVDLIGQRVKLKKSGRTYSGCCPFHQEKTPSFHVYREKGYYHCFGCQANGNAIRFLMDIDQRNFIDVMKDLSQRTGIDLPQDDTSQTKTHYTRQTTIKTENSSQSNSHRHSLSLQSIDDSDVNLQPLDNDYTETDHHIHDEEIFNPTSAAIEIIEEERSLYKLLQEVTLFYQQQLQQHPHAQNYFQNRQLTPQSITYWQLGYAPNDWTHLEKHFPHDIEGLKLLGLIRENDHGKHYDLLRDRVIFPIRDHKGRVVGFGGRALNDDIKPKYINSPDSEVFHKNQLLFGLYEGRQQKTKDWLMVEGYMDVIALHQARITGAVATLGTASNSDHLSLLFKQSPQLTLAFDGDAAGQKAALRTLDIALPLLSDGRELRFFILPEQHDPDTLIKEIGLENFTQQLQQAPRLSDYLFAQLSKKYDIQHPEGKSALMAELRQLSQQLPNGSYKYLLQQSFRERLNFGRKKIPQELYRDHDLTFTSINHYDLLIYLLMHYPILFPHFQPLLDLLPKVDLKKSTSKHHEIKIFLNIFKQIHTQLPADLETSRYFVLGAMHSLHAKILPILQQQHFAFLQITKPEDLEKHAQNLFIYLQISFLQEKLKQRLSLQDSQKYKQQLNHAMENLAKINLLN